MVKSIGAASPDYAQVAPSGFAGSEGEGEEGGVGFGGDETEIIGEDRAAAGVALGFELLEDLRDRIIVLGEEVADSGFEGFEFAGALGALGLWVTLQAEVPGDGAGMELEMSGDLRAGEPFLGVQFVNLMVRMIVNHGDAPDGYWG